jgi:hypothetical protein
MPRYRWITWNNETRTLRGWAMLVGMAPGTLADRLQRLPMDRALATGLVDCRRAGQLGKAASSWSATTGA